MANNTSRSLYRRYTSRLSSEASQGGGEDGASPYTFEESILTEESIAEPPEFKVLIYNDNFTTMEFVVSLLTTLFHKTEAEAEGIMLKVHREGFGVAGVYPKEIAETKVEKALSLARKNDYPLQLSLEEV